MAKDKTTANDNPDQVQANNNENQKALPPIIVNNQYIRDFSLEIPHAPEIFRKMTQAPSVQVNIDVNAKYMHDNFFNVELSVAMDGDVGQEKLFILELKYAAVVALNVPQEHVEPILLVEIPRLLFPFARNVVTNCLVEGGLPPFMINPVDFVTMYNNKPSLNGLLSTNGGTRLTDGQYWSSTLPGRYGYHYFVHISDGNVDGYWRDNFSNGYVRPVMVNY